MTDTNRVRASSSNGILAAIVSYGLFLAVCTAAFLFVRRFWVLNPQDLSAVIARANIMSLSFSLPFSVFAFQQIRPVGFKGALYTGATAGFLGVSLCTIIIGGEIAQGVHKAIPDYWDWGRDWPVFVFSIVGKRALIGACLGTAVATICWICKRKLIGSP